MAEVDSATCSVARNRAGLQPPKALGVSRVLGSHLRVSESNLGQGRPKTRGETVKHIRSLRGFVGIAGVIDLRRAHKALGAAATTSGERTYSGRKPMPIRRAGIRRSTGNQFNN